MTKSTKTPQSGSRQPEVGFQVDSNVIWGVAMLALGYTGAFADSSFALYLVGGGMLVWGVFRTAFPPAVQTAKEGKKRAPAGDGLRETVESLVVAFILAFLFKSFEAEAFVIPTGSMAPTLLGRHKDVDCEQCGYHYTVGASQELVDGRLVSRRRLSTSRCPNCRFTNDIFELPPFPGDRIIVTKLYEKPNRFDVIVFKYPEEPHVNYIKRCVGMPNETVSIMQGDIYRRVNEGDEWEILRKPDPYKQQRIQMLVYDDRFTAKALAEGGWPSRWAGVGHSDAPDAVGGWGRDPSGFLHDGDSQSYSAATASAESLKWLRYRHFVAGTADWQAVLDGQEPEPVARLVSDFCGYNMGAPGDWADHGMYWVGDLTVQCRVEIKETKTNGQLVVELVEGFNTYRAKITPSSGKVSITRTWEGTESQIASAETAVSGPGTYDIRFANVDNRLTLWIDETVVELGEGAMVKTGSETANEKDLCPVGIGAKGMDLTVSELVLFRDIYYRDETYTGEHNGRPDTLPEVADEQELIAELSRPDEWHRIYSERRRERDFDLSQMVTYELGPDEYLMFGDNSPKSQDSRLFPQGARIARRDDFKRFAVPADAIIGKAFFVYWPHGKPFLNEGKGYPFPLSYHVDENGNQVKEYPNHRVPFYPNVKRMRRIR